MKIIISIVKTSFVVIATSFISTSLSIKSVYIDNPSNQQNQFSLNLNYLIK